MPLSPRSSLSPRWAACALAVLFLCAVPAAADITVGAAVMPPSAALEAPATAPAGLANAVAPLAVLPRASDGAGDLVESIAAWNRAGRRPLRNGAVRPLPAASTVHFGPELLASPVGTHAGGAYARVGDEALAWGAEVRVDGAHRLRLHLSRVTLPAEARLWVYGDDGRAIAFDAERADAEGGLWTPSVTGGAIRLEVEVPRKAMTVAAGTPGFTVDSVLELFRLDAAGAPVLGALPAPADSACVVDVSCVADTYPSVGLAQAGIAQLEFVDGVFSAVCTGGLLNDQDESSFIPYLLTANHCIDSAAAAASLEAFWDWHSATCGGTAPNRDDVPRTTGASLLVTREQSDVSLLLLDGVPGGRTFLGWTDTDTLGLSAGTLLHRISHPAPDGILFPQAYSQFRRQDDFYSCGSLGVRNFDDPFFYLHTEVLAGGDFGGSSGSPLFLDTPLGPVVVAQLFGACGEDTDAVCDYTGYDGLDGTFRASFPHLAGFLAGSSPPPYAKWLTTPEQPGYEFQVRVSPSGSPSVEGRSEPLCIQETLCVSGALTGRPEVFVKLIGPRPNGFLWVQVSRFTPSLVEVWVRQTSSGLVRSYKLPAVGATAVDVSGLQDREAFTP